MMLTSFCINIFVVITLVTAKNDPCNTTNVIDEWRRSVAFGTGELICDNLLVEGWYRVTSGAGELMPTSCPFGGFRCNTDKSIYLSDDGVSSGEEIYPGDGITVNRTAYAANYDGNCQYKSYEIMIKNCTSFYVYYLVPTSGGCSSYCFGDQLPCPEGTNSTNGFTPGCKATTPVTNETTTTSTTEMTTATTHETSENTTWSTTEGTMESSTSETTNLPSTTHLESTTKTTTVSEPTKSETTNLLSTTKFYSTTRMTISSDHLLVSCRRSSFRSSTR